MKLLMFVIFIIFQACKKEDNAILENKNIYKIKIHDIEGRKVIEISDKNKIHEIVGCIKNSKMEPSKFLVKLKWEFISNVDTTIITSSKKCFSDKNGIKYISDCDLSKFISR